VALPNKLFEYLSSGLPVLSFPHKAQKEFIETNKMGLVFDDINGLDDLMKESTIVRSVKSNAAKRRLDFTIEANISRVLDLYRSVLE